MLHKELRKNFSQEIKKKLPNLEIYKSINPLIKKFLNVEFDIDLKYFSKIETVEILGIINFELLAIDARDGHEFHYTNEIDWNDVYTFNSELNDHANIIFGDDFDIEAYAIEQINMNIPLNLTINHGIISKTGSGWSVMSEEEYLQDVDREDPDPRWEKLNEFSNKNNK
ncbi:hypothetical protein ESOMN_v1c02690 [Williamsoniiplasma somnilux]|uniref:DUF177 domain-containing protein n=1 Tax=Williamsoniiplasma somnilux TaxID=215578 RepID=A0A2K8P0W8_9MOLU|nr:YceD family protein [Williamsoniiplasma somnilux]ATZ18651.1 hypothetical protein ESOMN_v1c02690 [Williamsoniiplasma somnilux]